MSVETNDTNPVESSIDDHRPDAAKPATSSNGSESQGNRGRRRAAAAPADPVAGADPAPAPKRATSRKGADASKSAASASKRSATKRKGADATTAAAPALKPVQESRSHKPVTAPAVAVASAPLGEEDVIIRFGGSRPVPSQGSSSWTDKLSESFYELELEVRSQATKPDGQNDMIRTLAAEALKLIGENVRRMSEQQADRVNEILHGIDLKDYLDPNFWQGIKMVLEYQVKEQVEFVQRRLRGEYETDPYGMDREVIGIVRPFLTFMYRSWWRISSTGLENVPADGRTLLVSNHSGVLPWDGAMIATAVAEDHPAHSERIVRGLHLHWFSTLPFVAPALAAIGQVPGLPENAVRLLDNDELVAVFPEGLKGVGKLFKDRYKLARFGRGGFVQAALRTGAPIVPVAVVGAEEIYPMLGNSEPLAKILGFPYFPLTPFFPWLGVLGIIPLPTRWRITFCPPIPTAQYGPDSAADPLTVLALAEQVRDTIQETIDTRLAERKSVF